MRDAVIRDEIHVMGMSDPGRLKRQRRFCGRLDLLDDLLGVAFQYGHIHFVIQHIAVGAFVDDDVGPRRESFPSEPAREDDWSVQDCDHVRVSRQGFGPQRHRQVYFDDVPVVPNPVDRNVSRPAGEMSPSGVR